VEIEWMPFQIDPGTDRGGEDMEAYCRRRWGGSGWTRHLRQEGRRSGANFGGWKWWPHTGLAHQFVQFGKELHGADTHHLNLALFEAMYESGQNLSSVDALVDLARSRFPDWDADRLRRYLLDNAGRVAVRRDIQAGRQKYGVSSVPYFVVGIEPRTGSDRLPYGLSGAQPSSTFLRIFSELAEEANAANKGDGEEIGGSSRR
jgi:predicted DsbA family dithiol-disulfide isomerase